MGSSCFEVKNKNKDKKKECNKDNTTQCGDKNKVPVEDVSLLENKDNNNKKNKDKNKECNNKKNDENSIGSGISFENNCKDKPKVNNSIDKFKNSKNFNELIPITEGKEIQDFFFNKNENDEVYSLIKQYEKEELTKEFSILCNNYIQNFLIKEKLDLKLDKYLISGIIGKENCKKIYKNLIVEEINNIKSDKDNSNYKIEYLSILLIGRVKVGKTTLIKYMLNLNDSELENDNDKNIFKVYKNNNLTYLRLIEFKGIGYDENNNPEIIMRKTKKFIEDRNKSKNYNDFIHCIWYCIKETRLEDLELLVLQKLKNVYKDSKIPIILVYTNSIDNELADEMKNYLREKNIDDNFVKVLAKETPLENTNDILPVFGKKELLNLTVTKCTEALSGEMIRIMVEKLYKDIKNKMLDNNKKNEGKIKEDIKNEFLNYKKLLEDQPFLDYILNSLGRKLSIFYNKEIYNSSLNLIIQSKLFTEIKNFIKNHKKNSKKIIKSSVSQKANIFIDYQVIKEKERRQNIKIENKRDINGFKKTNEVFLKQNLYYIFQKYLINYLIQNFYEKFFKEFRKQLDIIIETLLNPKVDEQDNKDIDNLLIDCFSSKLNDFAIRNKIEFKKENNNIKEIIQNDLPEKNEINDEDLMKNNDMDSNNNNNESKSNNIESDNNENLSEKLKNNEENEEWFPLYKKSKYINDNLKNSLNMYLQKIEYQYQNINLDNNDKVFKSLMEYIIDNLKIFFNLNKKEYIKSVEEQYNKNKLNGNKIPIYKIFYENENALSIYKNKIKFIFDKFKNDESFAKIDYISTIVIGKAGVGKSTLINSLLKLKGDKKAVEKVGGIGTVEFQAHKGEDISFLRIIDTRGIELTKKYGPEEILKITNEKINEQKDIIEKSKNGNKYNENNYNDYVQCIWYCISNNGIDPQEIDIIKVLKEKQEFLPIIVIYTNAKNKESVNNARNEIKSHFGDIPFIPVLARSIKNVLQSFGLDKLLYTTLDVCQKAVKSDIFNDIKNIICEETIKELKKENEDIKKKANIEIVNKFIQNYNIILDKNNLVNFFYGLLELVFIKYLNNEGKQLNSQSKSDLMELSMLTNSIEQYINCYEKNAQKIVDSIVEKNSLKYLDMQAKKEIKEFKQNIEIKNKCSKKEFIKIITTFLNNNFYYISQKYIIFRLITDVIESFSEDAEKEINKIIIEILNQNDVNEWCQNIYSKKVDDLINVVKEFMRKEGYGDKNNSKKNINNSNNRKKELDDYNCQGAPYPVFD